MDKSGIIFFSSGGLTGNGSESGLGEGIGLPYFGVVNPYSLEKSYHKFIIKNHWTEGEWDYSGLDSSSLVGKFYIDEHFPYQFFNDINMCHLWFICESKITKITNEIEYQAALLRIEHLMEQKTRDPNNELNMLATLIESYEDQNFPLNTDNS